MPKNHRKVWRQKVHQKQKQKRREVAQKEKKTPAVAVTIENAEEVLANFIKFYKTIKLIPEEEWDDFLQCLLSPLPLTFRFGENHRRFNNILEGKPGCTGQAEVLRDFFKECILPTTEGALCRQKQVSIEPVSMFPKDLTWKCNVDHKGTLGNQKLKKFRTFLFEEERGNYIFKQDIASMVGAWLVDIHPNHKILELSSSPGLQSSQIMERMHANPSQPAEGFLVCNNSDRASAHQLNFKWTLGPNTMFVQEKAEKFPDLYTTAERPPESKVEYDIIFLDAPSMKDAGFRKFPEARGTWSLSDAYEAHKTLKLMIMRAAELLTVDGRLVYQTTSLNPVENEAVVAELLRQTEGSLKLVDIRDRFPDLKTRPGMEDWKVSNPGMVFYEDYSTAPGWFRKDHEESLFPPTSDEIQSFQLNKCMRLMPHDNDTNGAFYAVLRKLSPLPSQLEKEIESEDEKKDGNDIENEKDTTDQPGGKAVKTEGKNKKKKPLEYAPFVAMAEIDWITEVTDLDLTTSTDTQTVKYNQPALKIIRPPSKPWYGIKCFTRFEDVDLESPAWQYLRDTLGLRLENPEKCLLAVVHDFKGIQYLYTTPLVKQIIQSNKAYFHKTAAHAGGLFLIQASEVESIDKLVQSQLPMCLDMKKQVVCVTKSDVIALLSNETVHCSTLSQSAQQELEALDNNGPIYFVYEPKGPNPDPKCPLVLMRFKRRVYLQAYIYHRIESSNLLRLCGVDTIPDNPVASEPQTTEPETQELHDKDGQEDGEQQQQPDTEAAGGEGSEDDDMEGDLEDMVDDLVADDEED